MCVQIQWTQILFSFIIEHLYSNLIDFQIRERLFFSPPLRLSALANTVQVCVHQLLSAGTFGNAATDPSPMFFKLIPGARGSGLRRDAVWAGGREERVSAHTQLIRRTKSEAFRCGVRTPDDPNQTENKKRERERGQINASLLLPARIALCSTRYAWRGTWAGRSKAGNPRTTPSSRSNHTSCFRLHVNLYSTNRVSMETKRQKKNIV